MLNIHDVDKEDAKRWDALPFHDENAGTKEKSAVEAALLGRNERLYGYSTTGG